MIWLLVLWTLVEEINFSNPLDNLLEWEQGWALTWEVGAILEKSMSEASWRLIGLIASYGMVLSQCV